MKKIICLTLSICLLLACFTAVAFGADSKLAEGGFYMKSVPSGVHVKLQSLAKEMGYQADTKTVQITSGTPAKYARVFDGAVKCTITFENALADDQYIVLMYTGIEATPTSSNVIKYINQYSNGDSFVVYPADITEATSPIDITVLITSQAEGFPKKIQMGYAPKGTTISQISIGNADGSSDGLANSYDALAILKEVVWIEGAELKGNNRIAGDVDFDGNITSYDALEILKMEVWISDFLPIS